MENEGLLKDVLGNVTRRCEEIDKKFTDLQEELKSFKSKKEEKDKANEKNTRNLEELKKNLNKEIETLNRENSNLKENLNRKEKEIDGLRVDSQRKEKEIEGLRSDSQRKDKEIGSLKKDLDGVLRYLRATEADRMKKEQEEGLSSVKKIPLDILSDGKSSEGSLKGVLLSSLDLYFELTFRGHKDVIEQTQASTALMILFAPTDRWFDSLGAALTEELKKKYSSLFVILLKPIGDPTKLKILTDSRGFSSIFQILVSSDMRLLVHAFNDEHLRILTEKIHSGFAYEIGKIIELIRKKSEQKISLSSYVGY